MTLTWPQAEHADLGLIDDDHTEDMRKEPVHPAKNATDSHATNHQKEVD